MRSARLFLLSGLVGLAASVPLPAPAFGKDKEVSSAYPAGASVQTFAAHQFELHVPPKAGDRKPPWSFVLVLAGDRDAPTEFGELASDGYVVCSPKPKVKGGTYAAAEAEEILDIHDHLAKSLPLVKDRMHVVTINEASAFSASIAFNRRAVTVSYTLVATLPVFKSVPAEAKHRTNVLILGKPDPALGDPTKAIASLAEKVLTSEYRPDDGTTRPYFGYWLGAMDGRYEPGRDLSFEWISDDSKAPVARKRDPLMPDQPTETVPALTTAKEAAQTKHVGGFVYFWTATDAAKSEGKNLQNVVFFDAAVRAAAKPLVAVKLDRGQNAPAFARMGLKATPAVVVVDEHFNVIERFEGSITAPALSKAMVAAASPAPPK